MGKCGKCFDFKGITCSEGKFFRSCGNWRESLSGCRNCSKYTPTGNAIDSAMFCDDCKEKYYGVEIKPARVKWYSKGTFSDWESK